jgi:hypothetical protein
MTRRTNFLCCGTLKARMPTDFNNFENHETSLNHPLSLDSTKNILTIPPNDEPNGAAIWCIDAPPNCECIEDEAAAAAETAP